MRTVTLEELLEAGCHFGHQVTRQNPKARDYVFEARDNIHIIDLAKTKEGLEQAAAFVKSLAAKPDSTMLVLGSKRQAEGVVSSEVKRAKDGSATGLYSVTNRWIGGIFTNFSEVSKNFKRLQDLTSNLQSEEEKAKFTKKEVSLWAKEKQKLESFYGGIVEMRKPPDAIFVIDTHLEQMAVFEARKMGVTTIGITDTNADPELIEYAIPANDDAVGSIELILTYIIDAWIEGRKEAVKKKVSEESQGTKETKEHPRQEADQKQESGRESSKKEVEVKSKKAKGKNTTKK
ncbi:MAG TPA: 30S ribosomal protein S2 [Patescibacteria group bacterium]|nr:30S ribosomal protein S2 [Patescibacteria group bacterium]